MTVTCMANGQQLTPLIPDGRPTPSPTLSPSMINVVPLGTHSVVTGSGLPPGQTPGMTGGRSRLSSNQIPVSRGLENTQCAHG